MLHPLFIHLRDAIIAGSTGRMAMIILIYGGPLIGLPRIDVISMLGALVAPNKLDAVTLGGAIHFTLGVFFALIYTALWGIGIGYPIWWWGLIFGAVHGILVILMLFLGVHVSLLFSEGTNRVRVMLAILLNHMVFRLVVGLIYST